MRISIILLLLLSGCGHSSKPLPPPQSSLQTVIAQHDNNDVSRLIIEICPEIINDSLEIKDEGIRDNAKRELLALAAESDELKAEVIHSLCQVLDTPGLHLSSMNLWHDVSDLLGELGGTESIDVLVKYIDYNDVLFTLTLGDQPTVKALIHINEPAVPKLIDALMHGVSDIKASAAITLGEIGSDQAKAGLERALEDENEERVTILIKSSLEAISRRRSDEAWRRQHNRHRSR
jgi:hypothetical protein